MRVAVTGIGLASPLGHTTAEVFENARAGRSAIRRLDTPYARRLLAPLAATVQFDGAAHFDPPKLRMLDRVSQIALVAAGRAFAESGVGAAARLGAGARVGAAAGVGVGAGVGAEVGAGVAADRAGVFVGTGMAGSQSSDEGYRTLYGDASDRIKPYTVLLGMHNAPAGWIAIEHGLRGPNLTYSTACSSSTVAIGEACGRLARGELDVAIAGGAEAPLSLGSLKAWEAMHTLASIDAADPSTSCKPFARDRSGMVLGEGAAMLVLEPWERAVARGATVHGEVIGYGLATDAGHITRPSVEGQAAAMAAALQSAGLDAAEVDAINAHGTGTAANDGVETAAIKAVFGARAARIPISATKAIHGHLLGAAGALECVLSLLALRHGVALPTMHLQHADPACDLDYVAHVAREGLALRTMLSNSFAFGGTNAVLALRAAS